MSSASPTSSTTPAIVKTPTDAQSISKDHVAAVPHAIDLWEKAAQTLNDEDKLKLDFSRTNRLAILNDVLVAVEAKKQRCMDKRWKYTKHNGDVVILRDVFEKMVGWVNKFKEVGDMAVQYDTAHAALPWAGIRLLLQVAVNDTETFGAMAEGVEFVSNLITRYTIVEQLYLQKLSTAKDQLMKAITKLYAAVLKYLSKASRFYGRNGAGENSLIPCLRQVWPVDLFQERMALSIIRTAETGVERYIKEISEMQVDVDACVALVEAACRLTLSFGPTVIRTLIKADREQMNEAVENTLGAIDAMGIESERMEVFRWMSNVPYRGHHRSKKKDYLAGSCKWLLEKEKFIEWRKSSISSILWLRGIPGSGKSMLVYSFIEFLTQESSANSEAAPFAYFYCSRNTAEPERAIPDEILRCVLEQLSSSEVSEPIREPVVRKYAEKKTEAKGRNPEKLMLDETVDTILALLETNPATIVIDALDECDPGSRGELLDALDTIICDSASLVKVFVSSRDDGDIVCRLANSPNVFIQTSDNKVDIERFVGTQVAEAIKKKRLIKGNVSEQLKGQIIETLIDGAQGMFRWVSLQIQNLCDPQRMKCPDDISGELGRLPSSLAESYDVIYKTISNSAHASHTVAVKAMKWLICAQRPLESQELIAAISVDSEGKCLSSSNDDLLDACCNMIVLDSGLNVFRFAHLSVREYLERRGDYNPVNTHALALERCLDTYLFGWAATPPMESTVEQNSVFRPYADLYWPVHCQTLETYQSMEGHRQKLTQFLFQGYNVGPLFTKWVSTTIKSRRSVLRINPAASSYPPTPLFLACSFALFTILDGLGACENVDWNQLNIKGDTGLHLSALNGHEAVVKVLVEKGVHIDAKNNGGRTALHLAANEGREAVVRLLLENGANANAEVTGWGIEPIIRGRTALHLAAKEGHKAVVRLLLENGANVNVEEEEEDESFDDEDGWRTEIKTRGRTALHLAAKQRHLAVVQLLLDNSANVNAEEVVEVEDSRIKITTGGRTALHLAAEKGHEPVVWLLLESGANVNAEEEEEEEDRGGDKTTRRGRTALHLAAKEGHEAVVRLLLKNGANVNTEDEEEEEEWWRLGIKTTRRGRTALHLAAKKGHEAVVRLLLKNGANVNAEEGVKEWGIKTTTTRKGRTALHLAAKAGHEAVVRLLLENGANVNAEEEEEEGETWGIKTKTRGRTALHLAAKEGHEAVMRLLLENDANVNAEEEVGEKVEEEVVEEEEVVKEEEEWKIKIIRGRAALHLAAKEGREAVVRLLLKSGANVNAEEEEELQEEGENGWRRAVTTRRIRGRTALHVAAEEGHEAVVWLLLENGANINMVQYKENVDAKTEYGETALQLATAKGHQEVVQLLLSPSGSDS